jgi:hypothetical protein
MWSRWREAVVPVQAGVYQTSIGLIDSAMPEKRLAESSQDGIRGQGVAGKESAQTHQSITKPRLTSRLRGKFPCIGRLWLRASPEPGP